MLCCARGGVPICMLSFRPVHASSLVLPPLSLQYSKVILSCSPIDMSGSGKPVEYSTVLGNNTPRLIFLVGLEFLT